MSNSSCRVSRRGLASADVLVVVAIIGLLLGVATSLARQAREDVRHGRVIDVFRTLEAARLGYADAFGANPDIPAFLPPGTEQLSEEELGLEVMTARSVRNNVVAVERLLPYVVDLDPLRRLPTLRFDGQRLLDPWGQPIVYDAGGTGLLGTARNDSPFFLSAGPDRDYRTRGDNLYSYEHVGASSRLQEPDESDRQPVDSP